MQSLRVQNNCLIKLLTQGICVLFSVKYVTVPTFTLKQRQWIVNWWHRENYDTVCDHGNNNNFILWREEIVTKHGTQFIIIVIVLYCICGLWYIYRCYNTMFQGHCDKASCWYQNTYHLVTIVRYCLLSCGLQWWSDKYHCYNMQCSRALSPWAGSQDHYHYGRQLWS